MKKKLLIALAMCMALGTGCGTETVEEEKKLRSVEITTVGKGEIASEFAYTGRAAASKTVAVIPMVPGKVTDFNFDVGDEVTEGAVLFTIDSIDLQNNMRALEASYHVAELARDNAKTAYENNQLLYAEEIISKVEFDQYKYQYDAAEAQLTSIQVQMDTLNKSISDCAVKAPISGVIATRGIERGGMAAQTAPAYTVMDLSVIKVEVGVSEQAVNKIHVGDEVAVLMTAVSEEPLQGVVATVAPTVGQTGTYAVTVELDNADGIIKAGMLAEVNFTAEKAEEAIVLPRNAVITKDDETYVYVIEKDTAKKVLVELGIESGEAIEITKGLKDGDAVVIKGQTYISDGEAVNVMNAEPIAEKETDTEEKGE